MMRINVLTSTRWHMYTGYGFFYTVCIFFVASSQLNQSKIQFIWILILIDDSYQHKCSKESVLFCAVIMCGVIGLIQYAWGQANFSKAAQHLQVGMYFFGLCVCNINNIYSLFPTASRNLAPFAVWPLDPLVRTQPQRRMKRDTWTPCSYLY